MKVLLSKISNGVKTHQADIILVIGVILISLLSFAMGYIVAKMEEKEPIKIEYENSNYWGRDNRSLSGLEVSRERS